MKDDPTPLSPEELAAETAAPLPDKEVISLLDLNADLNLALDAAAPIDLAVAANANVAAPIDASVGANVLSAGSTAQSLSHQGALIDQGITGQAVAHAPQDSVIGQSGGVAGAPPAAAVDPAAVAPVAGTAADAAAGAAGSALPAATPAGALDGNLLNVDVKLAGDLNLAAPINGAVAANANVAAPIDASVAANVGSVDSAATAISQQDAIITQHVDANADATADQTSSITQ